MTEAMGEHAQALSDRKFEEDLMEALKGTATIEAPPILTEREIDHIIMDEARALAQSGLQFESYLKAIGKTPEELREDRRESAENRVTTSLILNRLAEVEEVESSDEEIERGDQTSGRAGRRR